MSALETFANWEVLRTSMPLLLNGLRVTVLLGLTAAAGGFVFGLLLALVRQYGPRPICAIAVAYIDIFRAIPALVVLVFTYYGLPFAGVVLAPFGAAALALAVVHAAHAAEAYRAGLISVPRVQVQAAQLLGASRTRVVTRVLIPQAIRTSMPPLTSLLLLTVKQTSLASLVAIGDLMRAANEAQSVYGNPTPVVGAAVLYALILIPLVRLIEWFERARGSRV